MKSTPVGFAVKALQFAGFMAMGALVALAPACGDSEPFTPVGMTYTESAKGLWPKIDIEVTGENPEGGYDISITVSGGVADSSNTVSLSAGGASASATSTVSSASGSGSDTTGTDTATVSATTLTGSLSLSGTHGDPPVPFSSSEPKEIEFWDDFS